MIKKEILVLGVILVGILVILGRVKTCVQADMIPEAVSEAVPEPIKPQETSDEPEIVNKKPTEETHYCTAHCEMKDIQKCTKIEDIAGGEVYVENCVDYCGMFCNTWIPEGCEMQFRSASKGKCEK